jgi:Flp pilus assembly pilin Flp
MPERVPRSGRGEEGEGLTEYALIIALVAVCLLGIIQTFRNGIGGAVKRTSSDISHASTTSYGAGASPADVPRWSGGAAARNEPEKESADSAGAGEEPSETPTTSDPLPSMIAPLIRP